VKACLFVVLFMLSCCIAEAQQSFIFRVKSGEAAPANLANVQPVLPANFRWKPSDALLSADASSALDRLRRTFVIVRPADSVLAVLRTSLAIEELWPNRTIPLHVEQITNDSLVSRQYALTLLQANKAWAIATGEGVVVGVLDTGIDWNHPDLVERLAVNVKEDRNKNGRFDAWPHTQERGGVFGDLDGIDDDGNGWADDVIGFDFVDQDVGNIGDYQDRDGVPVDEHGHGTSVAGVIAASANNSIGIAGLARGARILTLRAFDATGNAEEDDVAAALLYAAANNVRIVNMSFGDGVDSPVLADAVLVAAERGALLVASAGNTGQVSRQYPAGYEKVMAVGATNESDRKAPFSSTGPLVDITAPGQDIWTTAIGSRYRSVNGTSFAAPYVAAAAALVWQVHPEWQAEDVRGTLRESSTDLGPRGFDPEFGNGRLDVVGALTATGAASVVVHEPSNGVEVDTRRVSSLGIRATVTSTQFAAWHIVVGIEGGTQWDTVASGLQQSINAPLASIDCTQLADGEYIARLVVTQTTGRTVEQSVRFIVLSRPLEIVDTEVLAAWHNNRRSLVVTSRANRATRMYVVLRTENELRVVTDQRHRSRTHSVVIPEVPLGSVVDVEVVHETETGDTARAVLRASMPNEAAPTATFVSRGGANVAGYVVNDVRPLYGDGVPVVLLNDLSSGGFGVLKSVVPGSLSWRTRDSVNQVWIPRAIGDVDGDGRLEVLAHVVGKAILFSQAEVGGSPFARVLWADTLSGDMNGATLADIDGDGRPEILCLNRAGLVAFSHRNGQIRQIGSAQNNTPPAAGSAQNRVDEISLAIGDFDGDGRTEVAFSDTDGDLVVAEWTGTEFVQEFEVLNQGQGGSGYVHARDVDGDGRPEIIHGVPDDTNPDSFREYGRQVWTYTMYRGMSRNTYATVWQDYFTGVRYGIGYRNGVEGGQLDMRGGDELVISVYPRLYIFRWDAVRSTMEPFWYTDGVATPRVAIADWNNNGVNEMLYGVSIPDIGFMTSSAIVEADTVSTRLQSPPGVRVQLKGGAVVEVSWGRVRGASSYAVELSVDGSAFERYAPVVETSWMFDTARVGSSYRVRITSVGATLSDSRPSAVVQWVMPSEVQPIRCSPMETTTTALHAGASFRVHFGGQISQREINSEGWLLTNGIVSIRASTLVPEGDSSFRVVFPGTPGFASGELTLLVPSIVDALGMVTQGGGFTIRIIEQPDSSELFLSRLAVQDLLTLDIVYSEPVEQSQGNRVERYQLRPMGQLSSATMINDSTVRLVLDPTSAIGSRGVAYTITVVDVVAISGREITQGSGNTLGFTLRANSIDDVYPYPHPVRLSVHDVVTFAQIPSNAELEIFDQSFRSVRLLKETQGLGGIQWDLNTEDGVRVDPGLYHVMVRLGGEQTRGKIMIYR